MFVCPSIAYLHCNTFLFFLQIVLFELLARVSLCFESKQNILLLLYSRVLYTSPLVLRCEDRYDPTMAPKFLPYIFEFEPVCKCILLRDPCSNRTNMVALPFCYVSLKAQKPRSKAYPRGLSTLGDHLRKKRLDMGIFQKEVAVAIGVDTLTVCNWENNLTRPRLKFLPKVFDFLGYNPLNGNATSLGETIKQYRVRKGLSLRKLARELDIDPGTIARWEKGESNPSSTLSKRLKTFLNIL